MPKRSSKKAGRIVRRVLADGTQKTYRYGPYKQRQRRAHDTLADLIAAWQRSPRWHSLAPVTQDMYTRAARPLSAMGAARADQVDLRDLVVVRDAIAATRGPGAATVFVRTASALFGWAVESGFLKTTPALKLRRLPGGHLPAWTEADLALALRELPEHLGRPLILAAFTGQRRGDLVRLRWSDYDGARITLVQEKTAKPLVVPCHPTLKATLDQWREGRVVGIGTILLNAHGRPWLGNSLSAQLTLALRKIGGFPGNRNIHGLRKMAAANLAHAGCTLHEIAAITGHKSLGMLQLYTASVEQERMAEIAIGRLVKGR